MKIPERVKSLLIAEEKEDSESRLLNCFFQCRKHGSGSRNKNASPNFAYISS